MSKVLELFGQSTSSVAPANWHEIVSAQKCPFLGKRCYKVRKSDPTISIGTCSVSYGREAEPVIICPTRLIERRQIFTDCLHLLTTHEPGNELHVVSEISIPGGSVDFFLVSARNGKIRDFVGIELQTLDTTGTVWPARQLYLQSVGVLKQLSVEEDTRAYGMNWKMTAKTILVQMHHKVQTFEHLHKKLALIIQDRLISYMQREFQFDHVSNPPLAGDSVHIHAYGLERNKVNTYALKLRSRLSTDADGIGRCLGLQAEARIELEQIIDALQAKISDNTVFVPI